MDQDDIFKLLLLVLLISNGNANSESRDSGQFSCLNEVIIVALLLGSFGNGNSDRHCDRRDRDRDRETTF